MNPTVASDAFFDTLNDSQREAVEEKSPHLLIVAGPGTGKTHTLVHRIARICPDLSAGQQALAITFTNKAAAEMRERLHKLYASTQQKAFIGTFHSFCWQLIRRFSFQCGIHKDYQLVDEMVMEEAAKSLWPQLSKKKRKELLNRISWHKSVEFEKEGFQELADYNAHLKELEYLDYDDVIVTAIKLLEDDPLRQSIQQQYPFIFVDEYQDINPAQHKLLLHLVGPKSSLTAIGDPLQAIYGFRGSSVKYFDSFASDFPGAKTAYLADNYRSPKNILSASSQVMAKGDYAITPLTAQMYAQGHLIVHGCAAERAEAEYVVHTIERLIGGTSLFSHDSLRVESADVGEFGFDDIAILYRLNAQVPALLEAFERSGLPYHIASKQIEDDVCPSRGGDVTIEAAKVSLMTLHAAKGLEFPVVFIVGCEENILPLSLEGMSSDIEEERRLFYVGMTRAKKRLYLTHTKKRTLFGKRMNNPLSRFVEDIEAKLKQYEQAERKFKKKEERQISLFKDY